MFLGRKSLKEERMKKWILLVALTISALQWSACTSTDTQDETEVAVDDTAAVDGELERIDGLDSDTTETTDASSEGFLDEQLPADALGETVAQEVPAETPVDEVPASEAFASEPVAEEPLEPVPQDSLAGTDTNSTPGDSTVSPAEPIAEAPSFESSSSFDSAATSTPVAEAASSAPPAPLRKIDSVPRMGSDGKPLNAVYIARPGDNFGKISERIFGDRSKLGYLRAENPFVKTVRPGSKIYYNSPARPEDSSKVLTYFEDQGMMPEVYVAQEGDNIRKVSENLLGYDRAWMEIWSTNLVESKQVIAAGTELRYWKNMPAAPAPGVTEQTTLAGVSNTPPPMDPAMDLPPPPPPADMAANLPPPPPPMDPAMDLPPPPPPEDMAAMDLPPPPPADALNPPPPPPPKKMAKAPSSEGDQDLMTALGAGAVLVAGIALLMIIRKRKQKKDLEAAFNDTQVGT